MAEEIDDNGFYREDFSAESDWEVFNAQLCDLFQKWELSRTEWGDGGLDINKCKWQKEEEELSVLKKQITVQYYRLETNTDNVKIDEDKLTPPFHEDLMCLANTLEPPALLEDKPNDVHYLARMYGLRRFVVIHPTQLQKHYLTKTSKFSFFLSSISVVSAEVCSAVPIFLQIHNPKWNFFLGVGLSAYMRTNFDSVALEQAPKEYLYLSGLIKMFKQKLPRNCDQPAVVSVRHTYEMDPIKLRIPMYVPFNMTPLVDEIRSVITVSHFTALPHGYFPVSNTVTFGVFTWPELVDNMFIDSELQTQFVPSKAPCGTLHQVVHANSYLTACLKDYYKLINATNALESYVGGNFPGGLSSVEENPLDKLAKVGTRRQSKLYVEKSQAKLFGPMNEHELNQMLYYLFPDMDPVMTLFPYEVAGMNKVDPHRIKSAEADSLVNRLSCLLATCYAHFGSKSGMTQMYASFARELRSHWDTGIPIPGVAGGLPDTRTCLLHQKLQMLNVCIEKRLQREKGIKPKTETENQPQDMAAITDDDTEEEEFYNCTDDESDTDGSEIDEEAVSKIIDIVPKTEDQLQGDAAAMTQMDSVAVSDSKAFKADNPNVHLKDSVSSFSPKEGEEYKDAESDEMRQKLSARMQAADSTRQTLWEHASKQKFDETQEGYKILTYLESRNLGEIFGLTVVPLLHSSVLKLKEIFINSEVLELFNEHLDDILADLSHFSRDIEIVEDLSAGDVGRSTEFKYTLQLPDPQPILNKIEQLERYFYQYKCFELMLDKLKLDIKQVHDKFHEILKNNGSCSVTTHRQDNPGKVSLRTLFKDDMPEKSKDYVIRLGEGLLPDSTLATSSDKDSQLPLAVMPQFMRAIVTGDNLRLCGAFTENITFLD